MEKIETFIEKIIFAGRWFLAPLYLGLALALIALGIKFFQEAFHVVLTIGTLAEDQGIEFKANGRITEKYPDSHVNVTAYNRMVLLTGEVATADAKADVERIARAVENVRGVYNELRVGAVSKMSERTNDAYVTSKVKARFIDARSFNPINIKVVTEAGTVYLMGLANKKEAEDATELARTTSGVQKVVRVFEYVN